MSKIEDFTLENAKKYHPNSSAKPIEAWFTIPEEEILLLSREGDDAYYLVTIHIDNLDPDWEHLKGIHGMFIPDKVAEKMINKMNGDEK